MNNNTKTQAVEIPKGVKIQSTYVPEGYDPQNHKAFNQAFQSMHQERLRIASMDLRHN